MLSNEVSKGIMSGFVRGGGGSQGAVNPREEPTFPLPSLQCSLLLPCLPLPTTTILTSPPSTGTDPPPAGRIH